MSLHRAVSPRPARPTLNDVAAHPELADGLPPAECGALLVQATAVTARLSLRLSTLSEPDRLMEAAEAADVLRMHRDTLRRKARKDPRYAALRVDTGTKALRFSAARVHGFAGSAVAAPSVATPPPRERFLNRAARRPASDDWITRPKGSRHA